MNQYFLSNEAESDIDDIISYIANKNPASALKFLDSLYAAMSMLADNSMIGHKRDDITNFPIRFWTFKWHYVIIYKDVEPIEIVRVLSGYRDIATLVNIK